MDMDNDRKSNTYPVLVENQVFLALPFELELHKIHQLFSKRIYMK